MSRLRRSAIVAFSLHLLASASLAFVLRHGLETNADFTARLNFLVNHRILWTFGWFTWTAAALAILYFYMTFAITHEQADRSKTWLRFAVR